MLQRVKKGSHGRSHEKFAALIGGAMLVPVVSLGIAAYAAGEATPLPAQSPEPFCQNVRASDQPFTDISGNTFERAIECLAAAQITRGGPGTLSDDQYGRDCCRID